MFDLSLGITVDPSVRFGKPVIKGTRVPADTIVARLASGISIKEVAEEYGITERDVYNALHYAAIRLSEEQVWTTA
jgi:uncharacterized protein (DUF433 family)